MKKSNLIGLISELSLAFCALICLVISAIFGNISLLVVSAVVMLVLLYAAGGFLAQHLKPELDYYLPARWLWNVFCKQWVWQIFCKKWVRTKAGSWQPPSMRN